jgi:hypothetical protein
MLQTLYKYLILHKKAVLPGVGIFYIHRKPASLDFSNKAFVSPVNEIAFEYDEVAEDKNFYSFLAKEHSVEKHEALNLFGTLSRKVKESLQTQHAVQLPRFGLLTKDVAGKLHFKPFDPVSSFYPNVPVERAGREAIKKEPAIEVEEKESQVAEAEMDELRSHSTRKEYWWIFAIVLAAAAIAAIIYYYNENGSLR